LIADTMLAAVTSHLTSRFDSLGNDTKVDISPTGQPPPELLSPFIGVAAQSWSLSEENQMAKYTLRIQLKGTIRARPEKTTQYGNSYRSLINSMELANFAVFNSKNLMDAMKSLLLSLSSMEAYHLQLTGVFMAETMPLIPQIATPEWFNSKDQAHQSDRKVGWILTSTIRCPSILVPIDCPIQLTF